jgi:ribonuclease HIII
MPSPFVTTVDLSLATKLREDLTSQGFELLTPPYTIFAARKEGVSCTLYQSGKLVVQGARMREFIEFYLEPEILHQLPYTHPTLDLTPHIGSDEAGKGDFFGPLCVAAAYADNAQISLLHRLGVADSKTLSDARIHYLATEIRKSCAHHVLLLRPAKYNELYARFGNLNQLLAWGHATVIEALVSRTGCTRVIVDQFANNGVLERAIDRKGLALQLVQKTQAEADLVVASASILARDAFVTGLQAIGKPYEMELPKGAGPPVLLAGRRFIAQWGRDALGEVAKLHFKTLSQL